MVLVLCQRVFEGGERSAKQPQVSNQNTSLPPQHVREDVWSCSILSTKDTPKLQTAGVRPWTLLSYIPNHKLVQ